MATSPIIRPTWMSSRLVALRGTYSWQKALVLRFLQQFVTSSGQLPGPKNATGVIIRGSKQLGAWDPLKKPFHQSLQSHQHQVKVRTKNNMRKMQLFFQLFHSENLVSYGTSKADEEPMTSTQQMQPQSQQVGVRSRLQLSLQESPLRRHKRRASNAPLQP